MSNLSTYHLLSMITPVSLHCIYQNGNYRRRQIHLLRSEKSVYPCSSLSVGVIAHLAATTRDKSLCVLLCVPKIYRKEHYRASANYGVYSGEWMNYYGFVGQPKGALVLKS